MLHKNGFIKNNSAINQKNWFLNCIQILYIKSVRFILWKVITIIYIYIYKLELKMKKNIDLGTMNFSVFSDII